METAKKNKTRLEIDRSHFNRGEREMLVGVRKKLVGAQKKKTTSPNVPIMHPVEPRVGVREKTALVNKLDNAKLRSLADRLAKERTIRDDHAD